MSPCHNHQVQRWNFFLHPATQRLLRCKLQEKLLRVTWPLYLLNLRSKNRKKLCLLVFFGGVIPVMHSVLASMFIHTREGSSSFNNRWLVGDMQQDELMVAIVSFTSSSDHGLYIQNSCSMSKYTIKSRTTKHIFLSRRWFSWRCWFMRLNMPKVKKVLSMFQKREPQATAQRESQYSKVTVFGNNRKAKLLT